METVYMARVRVPLVDGVVSEPWQPHQLWRPGHHNRQKDFRAGAGTVARAVAARVCQDFCIMASQCVPVPKHFILLTGCESWPEDGPCPILLVSGWLHVLS